MDSGPNTERTLADRVDEWLSAVREDTECRAATQHLALQLILRMGTDERRFHLAAESVSNTTVAQLALSAPAAVWEDILSAAPPPGKNSFGALQRQCPEFEVEANPLDVARALRLLERIFELAHGLETEPHPVDEGEGLSSVCGRHALVRRDNASARIFYEQAGAGWPLVMLHTAGADSRQYLDLLVQPRLTDEWTCYAFDMPLHGRSSPPSGWEWGTYRLTMQEYTDWCLAFIQQVIGEPAVVVGCSMGASISIALAASGSSLVKGVVALEAPDKSPGRLNPYLNHPAVNSAEYDSAYVRGLMSPTAPLSKRRHAGWIYSQGGPGVYPGDLWFYSEEYDGLALAPHVDTSRCPVHLLTGAYDYSAPPSATARLRDAIPGSTMTVMPELGHFPMTEDPARFLDYLTPVLASFRAAR